MLNKVMLIGNVGKDPEIRSTNQGTRCAESWKDCVNGERKERTECVNFMIFPESLVGIVERYVNK